MKLLPLSKDLPEGALELVDDLGEGERGFGGRRPGTTSQDFIDRQIANADQATLPSNRVQQFSYFLLDDSDYVVGFVKIRPRLNDQLLVIGGNVGYYVKKDQRSKGYGNEALRLALEELRKFGVTRALVTAWAENERSNKVIANHGGVLESMFSDAKGQRFNRWWITLD